MKLVINDNHIDIELLDTQTSNDISKMRSFESEINTWGNEIYFKTPMMNIKLEKSSRNVLNFGEIAYWTQGNSIAIGFGPTPLSFSDEIRLITNVNIWGKFDIIKFDINFFKSIKPGNIIKFIN